ncbi:MAG: hypothetical protein Q4D58_07970 [Synergistaceae bacterium]|nr:hypothetical protein [Synergistaceae bacterium]
MPTIFTKDALRASVEAATGGHVTVLYDDKGYPSYMYRVPKFTIGYAFKALLGDSWSTSVLASRENETFPAFVKNDVEKSEIFIGCYKGKVYDGRLCSVPGVDPTTYINFDNASKYATDKGEGWHIMSIWERAALIHWCAANKMIPRGNTNYGRSHSATYEIGARQDKGKPGDATGSPAARTLTGSGPASWRHNREQFGIDDLCGNIWEWMVGLKLDDGVIKMISDNYFDQPEASWPGDLGALDSTVGSADGTGVTTNGVPKFASAVTKYLGTPGNDANEGNYSSEATFTSRAAATGYTVPINLVLAGIAPVGLISGSYETDGTPDGYFAMRNFGERFPIAGGNWGYGSSAGVAALDLLYSRASSGYNIGARPCFVA